MDYEDIKLILAERDKENIKNSLRKQRELKETVALQEDYNYLYNKLDETSILDTAYTDFRSKVTDAYVTEALTILVDNCIDPVLIRETYNQKLVRQLVSNFVKEEGSSELLHKFKRKSYLLSELAYICEQQIESVLEKADPDNSESFKLDQKDKKTFYDKLGKCDVDRTVTEIQNRVKKETQEFVDNNMQEKAKLSDALSKTQDKVEETKEKLKEKHGASAKTEQESQDIQESYINMGKRKAVDIRESRSKNVFECMVYNLSRAAMINESAGSVFIEDSRLNMDKIVEHCEVLYTFLTTLDSCKIINVDESYISEMLKDMSK